MIKLSRLLPAAIVALFVLVIQACHPGGCTPPPEPQKLDYLLFGHLAGFCNDCDAVFKLENGKLSGAQHRVISDPDTARLVQLSDASYQQVSSLLQQAPMRLFTGSTSEIQTLGSPVPDMGYQYIELSANNSVRRWRIEGGNVPSDVQPFVQALTDAIGKLQ